MDECVTLLTPLELFKLLNEYFDTAQYIKTEYIVNIIVSHCTNNSNVRSYWTKIYIIVLDINPSQYKSKNCVTPFINTNTLIILTE